ncbi:MAG: transposase-like protein [Candidatus Deianiraeaceae bacterium]|jgi:transposase-like protein
MIFHSMNCIKCGSDIFCKNGINTGIQRYKCKKCGVNFTRSTVKGYSFEIKIQALKMYKEGLGFRSIGRLLEVSFQTVANWVRHFGKMIKDVIQKQDISQKYDVVEVDEMWHFLKTNVKNCGFGLLLIPSVKEFLVLRLVEGGIKLQNNSLQS